MLQKIENQKLYHICKYKEYMLEVGKTYDTNGINRTHLDCTESKKICENAFENHRINFHVDIPSRKKCFYVCLHEDVNRWVKELTRGKRCECKIFRLSCTGIVFWTDSCYFGDLDIISPQKYWEGCDPRNYVDCNPLPEGLFYGEYTAIEECTNNFVRSI